MKKIYSYESTLEKDLVKLIKNNNEKRIVVLGTTCTGKSTILKNHPEYRDMDEEIYPLLTKEEIEYVNQVPWTEEIGLKMNELVRKRLKSQIKKPIFGTVIIDCDLLILISLDKHVLEARCKSRKVSYLDPINMHKKVFEGINGNNSQFIEIKTIPDNYYYCGIIEESLISYDILKDIKKYYNSTRISEMKEDEYHIPYNEIESIFRALSNYIKSDWYIHAFNTIENNLFVGLNNKYFKLPVNKDSSWEEMIEYGEKTGIERKWTESIPLEL